MKGSRSPRLLLLVAGATVALGTAGIVVGVTFTATPKLVTNTTGGRNENPSLDKQGEHPNHEAHVLRPREREGSAKPGGLVPRPDPVGGGRPAPGGQAP